MLLEPYVRFLIFSSVLIRVSMYSHRFHIIWALWPSWSCDLDVISIVVLPPSYRCLLSVAWPTGVQLVFFFCSGVSRLFGAQGSPSSGSLLNL